MRYPETVPVKDSSKGSQQSSSPSKKSYSSKFSQNQIADELKAKMRGDNHDRYSRKKNVQPDNIRPKSVSNKLNSKSMNQASGSSIPKVIDLKEIRDKEKVKKQARIGMF